MERVNAWTTYKKREEKRVMDFARAYRAYLDSSKTERECAKETIRRAEKAGYVALEKAEALKPGDRVYVNTMNKAVQLFIIGREPLEKGLNIVGAHIDSPRMDLKQNPLYEDTELVYLDTHYYGGIKKYQWVALPLALHGVVAKKDGTVVDVVIGEDEDDPVVGISDLLIHLSATQLDKKASVVIEGEALDVIVGGKPRKDVEKEPVKAAILAILKEKYGMEEEDFLSAEIEVVPAGAWSSATVTTIGSAPSRRSRPCSASPIRPSTPAAASWPIRRRSAAWAPRACRPGTSRTPWRRSWLRPATIVN